MKVKAQQSAGRARLVPGDDGCPGQRGFDKGRGRDGRAQCLHGRLHLPNGVLGDEDRQCGEQVRVGIGQATGCALRRQQAVDLLTHGIRIHGDAETIAMQGLGSHGFHAGRTAPLQDAANDGLGHNGHGTWILISRECLSDGGQIRCYACHGVAAPELSGPKPVRCPEPVS